MIRINLLPHRELRRAAQRRLFVALMLATAVIAGAIVIIGHGVLSNRIDTHNAKNQYLEQQIALLDKQIEDIRRLKEQTQALLARKKVVETLQGNRAETVHLLDQLARQLPDGVYLKSIKQTGYKVDISGFAQSNARVSTLMRNLEASAWLESPKLVEIKSAAQGTQRLNEFSLTVGIRHAEEALDGKKLDQRKKETTG